MSTKTIVGTQGSDHKTPLLKSPGEALTLSRFIKNGQIHTLAVLKDDGEILTGVDLSAELEEYPTNAFDIFQSLSYDEVSSLVGRSLKHIHLKYTDLLPCVAGKRHLAIGINYAEHGKETGQVKPFMFPKMVHTDPAVHQLKYTDGWLLDHEVEMGIVFPSPVCSAADLDRMMMGFLVVNDFTDRATLLRKMDSDNVSSGKGFPDAKSKSGFLPTGPYMVVPKYWRPFVEELQLTLSVNGKLRQVAKASEMVWNIDEIIRRSLAEKGMDKSYYQDRMIKLFEGNCIPANSIILTGTPAGVAFNAPSKPFIASRVLKFIFSGQFFKTKLRTYILHQYFQSQFENTKYLRHSDLVESSISYLGSITTEVIK